MKFRAYVTEVKTDSGYSRPDRLRVDFKLEDGPVNESAVFLFSMPKDHPDALTYLAAWQNNRPVTITVTLD